MCLYISSCLVCQHNGKILSEKAEQYKMDEALDSGESKNPHPELLKCKKITELSLNQFHFYRKSPPVTKTASLTSSKVVKKIRLPSSPKLSDLHVVYCCISEYIYTVFGNKSGPVLYTRN